MEPVYSGHPWAFIWRYFDYDSPSLPPFSNFLVNSADRVIRVFDIEDIIAKKEENEIEPLQKLQDLVNRWVELIIISI